jgi:hypothetical protein
MHFTEAYVRHVARDVTFWAWPMVDVILGRASGRVLPQADVVSYVATLALDKEPVVVQVPDFGDRFWLCLAADLRTDAFANLGTMYGTKPGFDMLVGPRWNGETPRGIARVFHARTNTVVLVPRVFTDGTLSDRAMAEALLNRLLAYPLSHFDGAMKTSAPGATRSVPPAGFFESLAVVLQDAPPLAGEETRYEEARALLEAMKRDAAMKSAAIEEEARAEQELVAPLSDFDNVGLTLPDHWTTLRNGADFGTDYYSRTAAARADIFLNRPEEERSFYLDRDRDGTRLNSARRYTVTFRKGALPPVRGFWSLALYDAQHAAAANQAGRFSLGTANKDLAPSADGSLVIAVQADEPLAAGLRANRLPAPKGGDFSLVLRAWWPESAIATGRWTPPPAVRVN